MLLLPGADYVAPAKNTIRSSLVSTVLFCNILTYFPFSQAFFSFFLYKACIFSTSFETINKLKLSFECSIPVPQDAGTPSLSPLNFF
jgi:hypothetical protein